MCVCVCMCVFIQPYVRIYVHVCVHAPPPPSIPREFYGIFWTDIRVRACAENVYVYLEERGGVRCWSLNFFLGLKNSIFDCNLRENVCIRMYVEIDTGGGGGEISTRSNVLYTLKGYNVITEASHKGRKQWQVVRK